MKKDLPVNKKIHRKGKALFTVTIIFLAIALVGAIYSTLVFSGARELIKSQNNDIGKAFAIIFLLVGFFAMDGLSIILSGISVVFSSIDLGLYIKNRKELIYANEKASPAVVGFIPLIISVLLLAYGICLIIFINK